MPDTCCRYHNLPLSAHRDSMLAECLNAYVEGLDALPAA